MKRWLFGCLAVIVGGALISYLAPRSKAIRAKLRECRPIASLLFHMETD